MSDSSSSFDRFARPGSSPDPKPAGEAASPSGAPSGDYPQFSFPKPTWQTRIPNTVPPSPFAESSQDSQTTPAAPAQPERYQPEDYRREDYRRESYRADSSAQRPVGGDEDTQILTTGAYSSRASSQTYDETPTETVYGAPAAKHSASAYEAPYQDSFAEDAPQEPSEPRRAPRRERRGASLGAVLTIAFVTIVLSVGGAFAVTKLNTGGILGPSGSEVATQAPVKQAKKTAQPDWQTVAKTVRPSVVAISVSTQQAADTGSGVIFDKQGHILTNYHVIANAVNGGGQLTIQLFDGRLFNGKVLGTDPTTDLAVVAFVNPPHNLTMTTLGSSDNLSVGQPVAAVGAPLGLSNTMTTGIISALNRPVTVNQEVTDNQGLTAETVRITTNAIQVDAAINPGNSGGPLFAEDGTVIGINSSIAAINKQQRSGSIGIGFAIPVNLVKKVADQILRTGSARHAFLGVRVKSVAVQEGSQALLGAELVSVNSGGAADAAGLQRGDVIIAINKNKVTSDVQLTGFVRWYLPGDTVTVTYIRGGKEQTAKVTLGQDR